MEPITSIKPITSIEEAGQVKWLVVRYSHDDVFGMDTSDCHYNKATKTFSLTLEKLLEEVVAASSFSGVVIPTAFILYGKGMSVRFNRSSIKFTASLTQVHKKGYKIIYTGTHGDTSYQLNLTL